VLLQPCKPCTSQAATCARRRGVAVRPDKGVFKATIR
jgi:hypothetical protein